MLLTRQSRRSYRNIFSHTTTFSDSRSFRYCCRELLLSSNTRRNRCTRYKIFRHKDPFVIQNTPNVFSRVVVGVQWRARTNHAYAMLTRSTYSIIIRAIFPTTSRVHLGKPLFSENAQHSPYSRTLIRFPDCVFSNFTTVRNTLASKLFVKQVPCRYSPWLSETKSNSLDDRTKF